MLLCRNIHTVSIMSGVSDRCNGKDEMMPVFILTRREKLA